VAVSRGSAALRSRRTASGSSSSIAPLRILYRVRDATATACTIVIDIAGLTFMDSTGVRLLVNAAARTHKGGHRLALRRGDATIQRVLQITGLEDTLPFTD
jgi:anti-anti-sigma factor